MDENEIKNLKEEMSELAEKQLIKAMVIVSIITIVSSALLSSMLEGYSVMLSIFACIVFIIFPLFVVPVIIRKSIKKNLGELPAIIYSVIVGAVVVVLTGFSILKLVVIFIPYYYLTNKPMFSNKRIKEIKEQLAQAQYE